MYQLAAACGFALAAKKLKPIVADCSLASEFSFTSLQTLHELEDLGTEPRVGLDEVTRALPLHGCWPHRLD
jgi:hypothetical protein